MSDKMPIELSSKGTSIIRTIEDAYRMAEMVFQSGLVPYSFKNPQSVLLAWEFGAELGLTRMQSLYNIAVINNRPVVYGKAVIAIVQSQGLLESLEERIEGEGDNMTAICTAKRTNFADPVTRRFSVADAKLARLWGKTNKDGGPSPWVLYPKDMLKHKARARTFGDLFADALCGMDILEDVREALTVERNERIQASVEPPSEAIHDPLMDQIGAESVPAEKPKRKAKTVEMKVDISQEPEPIRTEVPDAENAHVPPEDIPSELPNGTIGLENGKIVARYENGEQVKNAGVQVPAGKPVNSPGITVKTEVVYKCKACQDSQKNSKGGPCPICSPKKFEAPKTVTGPDDAIGSSDEMRDKKPLKNQSETKGPPVEIREVTFEKIPTPLGKGNFKYVDDEGLIYYSNATGVKSVVDANIGVKISIGVQEIESRMVIVSARQIA